jgi:hypothetical protein
MANKNKQKTQKEMLFVIESPKPISTIPTYVTTTTERNLEATVRDLAIYKSIAQNYFKPSGNV